MTNELPLDGKVALVTGAGSGIGRAIATLFADSGALMIVNDLNESGREVADEIGGVFLQADLADMEQAAALGHRAEEVEGRVDLLVNNAGLQKVMPVDEYPDELWAMLIQVMLIAPFQLTKRVLPGMKEHGWGRIINMASIHGLVASPFKSAYVSAKHGLIGLTKTVALEAGEYGITVQRHLSLLRSHADSRKPDRRHCQSPRHGPGRRREKHHARARGHQAADRAR